MASHRQKRSIDDGMQLPLPLLLPAGPDLPPPAPRGGGSAGHAPPATRGGGYLDNCTLSEIRLKHRPTLADLHLMGVPLLWLMVAEAIGIDDFLRAWQILDQARLRDPGGIHGDTKVNVPDIRRLLRHERKQSVIAMAAKGMTAPQIARRLSVQGQRLSERTIARYLSQHKDRRSSARAAPDRTRPPGAGRADKPRPAHVW